jgi:hypothetical protein
VNAKYKILDWLNVQLRGNYDRVEDNYEQRVSASTDPIESGPNGGYAISKTNLDQLYGDVLFTGNKDLSENISLSGSLGASSTERDYYNLSLSSTVSTSLTYPNYFSVYALNGQFNKSESKTRVLNQAAFGNLTLGYKEKLFLDLTGRNEWSSTVAQTFFYPSVGLTYLLPVSGDLFSFGKIRGSFARVANSLPFGVANFAPPYSLDNTGAINGRDALPFFDGNDTVKLKPEQTTSYEFGADLRFFKNKLNLNITYYNALTYDQVFQIQAPAGSGAANFWINGGTILNKGVEAILTYNTKLSKNLKWSPTVTFSTNKNQIRELSSLLKSDRFVLSSYDATRLVALFLTRPANGKYGSYGDMFGKTYLKDDKGKLLTDSVTGLPLLSKNADQFIGNANPNFLIGFNNVFTFNNFSLAFLIDSRFGGGIASATERWLDYKGLSKRTAIARDNGGVMVNGKLIEAKDYFYNQTGAGSQGAVSEYFFDATNIRMRELAVSYSIKNVNNIFKSLSFSLVGRNLFFFYKKAPFDPELSINASNGLQGIEAYNLPSTRSYGLSVRANF